MYLQIMETAKRRGYAWVPQRDFVGIINGQILYGRHIPIIFRPSLLKSLYGGEYRTRAHEALDVMLNGGNPLQYHHDLLISLNIK